MPPTTPPTMAPLLGVLALEFAELGKAEEDEEAVLAVEDIEGKLVLYWLVADVLWAVLETDNAEVVVEETAGEGCSLDAMLAAEVVCTVVVVVVWGLVVVTTGLEVTDLGVVGSEVIGS